MELIFRIRSGVFLCIFLLAGMSAYAEEAKSNALDSTGETETAAADKTSSPADSDNTKTTLKYDWAATGYVAWLSGDQLGDMLLFQAELSSSKIWVAALTRRIKTFYKDVDWEAEGQIAKQGGSGEDMRYWQFNALTSLRWNRFVWDKYVETSMATGLGVSYATDEPGFEIEEHGDTSKLLAYIMVEVALSPPKHPQWAGVLRIHHRSSAYGLFNDNIEGASNAFAVGVKYRF